MADKTKIEWADATVNTVYGCTKVSPGCQNCYAVGQTRRQSFLNCAALMSTLDPDTYWNTNGPYDWSGKVMVHPRADDRMGQVMSWTKPRRIFWNSMADTFHDGVPWDHLVAMFATMAVAANHTHLVLTKRPERMAEVINNLAFRDDVTTTLDLWAGTLTKRQYRQMHEGPDGVTWPLPNVLLGFTAEDQDRFNRRWDAMAPLADDGWRVFVSAEPLLGPLDIPREVLMGSYPVPQPLPGLYADGPRLSWVIVGGESGPNARPMDPQWVRQIVEDCQDAGVPVMFKQWGEWLPGVAFTVGRSARVRYMDGSMDVDHPTTLRYPDHWWGGDAFDGRLSTHVGKKAAGRLLDGQEHMQFPEGVG